MRLWGQNKDGYNSNEPRRVVDQSEVPDRVSADVQFEDQLEGEQLTHVQNSSFWRDWK